METRNYDWTGRVPPELVEALLTHSSIVGIDEAGYGAWAGPLYAVAVAVPCTWKGEPDVIDSKRLTPRQRETVFARYWRVDLPSIAIGVGRIAPEELDVLGAVRAMKESHRRALQGIQDRLVYKPFVVVDGNVMPPIEDLAGRVVCLPKADTRVPVVSLASIIAKVLRDREMVELGKTFPQYGFDKSMGYGTRQHRDALERHGVCAIHRRSYAPIRQITGWVNNSSLDDYAELFED